MWASEPVRGCFATPAEAAMGMARVASEVDPLIAQDAMNGTRVGDGFRVEGVRRDVLLGRSWALVRSCGHPERPAVAVEMLRMAGEEARLGRGRSRAREVAEAGAEPVVREVRRTEELARAEAPVLLAGSRVEVIRVEQNMRLRMEAVAERSAAVGERVRLRVVREAGEDAEFVEGVVRGAGLVEMEASR